MKNISLKRTVLICSMLFLLLHGFLHVANASDLDKIKQAIKEKGAKWTAGETSVSKLPENEKKLRTGTILDSKEANGEPTSDILLQEPSPASFDWRNKDGKNYDTPVKDQGGCGSCWAYAAIAQLEALIQVKNGTPDVDPDLSEQFLVSCCRSKLGSSCGGCIGCNGCYIACAYNFLASTGAIDEGCFPYTARDLQCKSRCKNWSSRTVKITSWSPVTRAVDTLKAAVYKNPLTVAFNVPRDFFNYAGGVYERTVSDMVGGHAVLILGWDDAAPYSNGLGCFFVKNSWGTDWGEAGYFKIAYSMVDDPLVLFGRSAGIYNGIVESSHPSTAPPRAALSETLVTLWGSIKINH